MRLVEDTGNGTGDYTINPATSQVTVKAALGAGSVLQWDLLVDPTLLEPGAVTAFKLVDLDKNPSTGAPGYIDGVRATFALRYILPADGTTQPTTVGSGEQVQVVLDGVMQEAGADYTASVATIVFTQAPDKGVHFSGVWYKPGA